MEQPLKFSEHDFINLPIAEIDSQARNAKKVYDLYQRYSLAMARLQLEALSKDDFCTLGDAQLASVEKAEDTATKWPEYSENMKRLGKAFRQRQQFLDLSANERLNLYQASQGTSRSAWQFLTGTYSARDGWVVYHDSLTSMGLPLKYGEYEFINLDSATIDNFARHARESNDIYSKLRSLCELAAMPCPYRATEIYASTDLSKWNNEYNVHQQDWAARILYADSCKRVDASPNWKAFEAKAANEQLKIAVLADTLPRT